MTKPLDKDILGLKYGIKSMETSTPRMRKATLEDLWDRYVLDPLRKKITGVNINDRDM